MMTNKYFYVSANHRMIRMLARKWSGARSLSSTDRSRKLLLVRKSIEQPWETRDRHVRENQTINLSACMYVCLSFSCSTNLTPVPWNRDFDQRARWSDWFPSNWRKRWRGFVIILLFLKGTRNNFNILWQIYLHSFQQDWPVLTFHFPNLFTWLISIG